MPFIEVNIIKGATPEQKAELIEGMTAVLVRVLNKKPTSTHVLIKEHDAEHWGVGGRTVESMRAEGDSAANPKS
jgi:4-oxalocrotonate tautomerase